MNYHCPNCDEIIYDRTRKICGICGAALPAELLLCLAEAQTLSKEAAETEQRHKRDVAQAEASEQKRCDGELLLSWVSRPIDFRNPLSRWPESDC